MISINLRFQLAASLVLVLFLSVTTFALSRVFDASATDAMRERLFARIYYLLAEADVDEAGRLSLPERLAEPALGVPGSGLYASIRVAGRGWDSPSAPQDAPVLPVSLKPGETRFGRLAGGEGGYFYASLGVAWETGERSFPMTVGIAEDAKPWEESMSRYRRHLWGWLGVMSAALLAALASVIRWGLQPLRNVSRELAAIEAGERESLGGRYPKELAQLTTNLNALLVHEIARRARYRDAMADLAHSLKTPLTIVNGLLSGNGVTGQTRDSLREQSARLDDIVQYHLQRASMAGPRPLEASGALRPLVERVKGSLEKVYHESAPVIRLDVEGDLRFRAAQEDLLEILGNLMDNACKWCDGRVGVTAECRDGMLEIAVDDDGPGITVERVGELVNRGVRLDEATPGHGIGLGLVKDIVGAYGGELAIGRSPLGGTRALVKLAAC
ncbi:MAG: ATP-binding protein [Pseudomonadota bacterium]|nr:ATP-binding protein [Pseudomonadota bacterium]